jgi:hypothetical protein
MALTLVGSLALAGGCGKSKSSTGFIVTVSFPSGVDQLQYSVSSATELVIMPTSVPKLANGLLVSPQEITVPLDESLAGQAITCTVTGFARGAAFTLSGSGSVTLTSNSFAAMRIDLAAIPAANDGGAPDAPTEAKPSVDAADEMAAPVDGLRATGQTCATGAECDSALCVSGVCCASACDGLCEACNLPGKEGTCLPIPAGTPTTQCAKQPVSMCGHDGTCDGNGGCRYYPDGVACKAAACQAASYVPASACDGQGACVAGKAVDCTPYVCDSTTGAPACRTDCRAGGADCAAPAVCNNSSCGVKPKQANGAGCVAAADCMSGFCADGVCCAAACTGACVSCNQAGAEGMCKPLPAGKPDPHAVCKVAGAASCGQNGLCDGAGACSLYPSGTSCAAASCNGRFVHAPKYCDGKGVCQAVADVDCLPYRCNSATAACFTSCTSNAQCSTSPRRTCQGTTCQQ